MPSIRAWAGAHPDRVAGLIAQDPRMIFFRASEIAQADAGPAGAMGIALDANVSVAIDPRSLPLGAPLLVRGLDGKASARLVVAQDAGDAIRGPLRIDLFEGTGSAAGESAGRRRDRVTLRLLVPRGVPPGP